MSTHSPAPWTWDASGDLVAADGTQIIETARGDFPPYGNDQLVLGAAPELLAALRECLPYMVWTTEAGGKVHSNALSVLHKATGVDPIDYYTNGEQE